MIIPEQYQKLLNNLNIRCNQLKLGEKLEQWLSTNIDMKEVKEKVDKLTQDMLKVWDSLQKSEERVDALQKQIQHIKMGFNRLTFTPGIKPQQNSIIIYGKSSEKPENPYPDLITAQFVKKLSLPDYEGSFEITSYSKSSGDIHYPYTYFPVNIQIHKGKSRIGLFAYIEDIEKVNSYTFSLSIRLYGESTHRQVPIEKITFNDYMPEFGLYAIQTEILNFDNSLIDQIGIARGHRIIDPFTIHIACICHYTEDNIVKLPILPDYLQRKDIKYNIYLGSNDSGFSIKPVNVTGHENETILRARELIPLRDYSKNTFILDYGLKE